MDTPRNNTLLSKAQLDALNIQNPGGFSYLTSSSYSDASFGQPNIPRIRGQYSDMFFNGMRDSFTLNGYGAPISFNSVDSIDIVKGPASVQAGPGAGVGGSIDITTKMPPLAKLQGSFNLEFDSQQKRRASFDVGGPLTIECRRARELHLRRQRQLLLRHVFPSAVAVRRRAQPAHGEIQRPGHRGLRGHPLPRERRRQPSQSGLIDNGTYLTGGPATGGDLRASAPVFTCRVPRSAQPADHHRRAGRAPARIRCTSRRRSSRPSMRPIISPSSTIPSTIT